MLDDPKEQLIERFRIWLQTAGQKTVAEPAEADKTVDLFALFVELAALKTEVKRESRQVKAALDEFKQVFALLETAHQQLGAELDQTRQQQPVQLRAALRPLLLELLELHERLEAGLTAIRGRARPGRFRWRGENRWLSGFGEAQEISVRRLQQLLRAQGVTPIECIGKPLDPHTMRVVEVDRRADLASGVVSEELRKGYHWHDELLRPAEVKVNKSKSE